MEIESIIIKGFRGISNLTLSGLDPHLNLLIGVNGAGKSSVLDCIAIMLSAFTSSLTTSSSKGLRISQDDIKRGQSSCSITIKLKNETVWTKVASRKLDKDKESEYASLNAYTLGFRQQLDSMEPISVPVIVHYGVKRSVTDIPLRFPKSDNNSPTAAYKDWYDSKASYRDIFPWLRSEEDYENELIRDNPKARIRGLEALRKAMNFILPEYSDMRVRRKPHLEVVLKKLNEDLPLSQMSDGEKCYIALVCDIVRRLSLANPSSNDILGGEGIVLIDEVDLHLHPSWEQSIMERLRKVFPNIQFIVTAHSPLIASNFDGKIFAVNKGNAVELPRIYGLDYSTILQDWMATPPMNKEINSWLDLYRTYSKHGMHRQAVAIKNKLTKVYHLKEDDIINRLS